MTRTFVTLGSGAVYGVAMGLFGVDYTNPAFYVGLAYGLVMSLTFLLEPRK